MSDYSEKLRDPRWQKMRLEIMERDDFRCAICLDGKSTLNVHHRYYDFGVDPWAYPETALVTLCEECHEREGEGRRESEAMILRSLRSAGALNGNLQELAYVLKSVHLNSFSWDVLIENLRVACEQYQHDPLAPHGPEWKRMLEQAQGSWKTRASEKENV